MTGLATAQLVFCLVACAAACSSVLLVLDKSLGRPWIDATVVGTGLVSAASALASAACQLRRRRGGGGLGWAAAPAALGATAHVALLVAVTVYWRFFATRSYYKFYGGASSGATVEQVRVNHFAYWHRWSDEEAALYALGAVGGTAAWLAVLALAAAQAWRAARHARLQPGGQCKIDIGAGLLEGDSSGGGGSCQLAPPSFDFDARSSCESCCSPLARSLSGLSSSGSLPGRLLSLGSFNSRSSSSSSSSRALSRTSSCCSDRESVAGAAAAALADAAAARPALPAGPRLIPVIEETLLDALLLPSLAQELHEQQQQQQQQQPAPD